MSTKCLPYFTCGEIVKGFGRGSKELGIPTANFPMSVVENLPKSLETGIYYGWANVNNGPVHEMVMSIGWNPFYHNIKKSMETHILHDYCKELYGCLLKVCILGFIRPEKNFDSKESLIEAINSDIKFAKNACNQPENIPYSFSDYFKESDNNT